MGKVIAVFNQKGGVGKTTTNVNLAAGLSMKGKKVLVIDNDPQGNSTSGFGIDKSTPEFGLYDVLIDEMNIEEVYLEYTNENLHIVPSNEELAGAELDLVLKENREFQLRNAINKVKDDYDYIIIDCPPSLGLLTINSLVASDSVLIPIQCEYYALEGLSQLMKTISLVHRGLNPKLQIEGVLLNMFDGRNNLSIQVVEEVKEFFKEKVYTTLIPRNVRLAEAPSFGLSIYEYDEKSKGAIAFSEFVDEFIERGERIG